MTPRWLCIVANAYVLLSLADGTLSLADEALRATSGAMGLQPARSALAYFVFAMTFGMLPALALTPRLPLAVFLPLVLGTLWVAFGAAPLGLWIGSLAGVEFTRCGIQIALSLLALAAIRRHHGGRRWLFGADSPPAPAFAWSRSLGFAAATLFAGVPLTAGYLLLLLAISVEQATAGFVSFDLAGVSLADRRYARGDREVRLVGMMHIGEDDAYREIVSSFATESTVVLAEGVTDREGLLSDSLEYGRAAGALGLVPQRDLRSYLADPADPEAPLPDWPEIRHADLDASAFGPETIEWLRWASALWAAPDLATALLEFIDTVRESDPAMIAAFERDVLDLRNAHLFGEIEVALDDYRRVIVPWGALHLPAIEADVLALGFEETSRALHPLISWSTIGAALLGTR